MTYKINIELIKFLKALDNSWRLKIVEFIINSSSVSFSAIHEHLEKQTGTEFSKGVISYHLDILGEGNVLSRELNRKIGQREYSSYSITDYALDKLENLDLLIKS